MTETKLRTWISILFMVAHVAILLLVVVLHHLARFTDDELTTTMGFMAPALSALTTLAVTFAISMKEKKRYEVRSKPLSGIYIFTAFLFPVGFVVLLFVLVIMRGMDAFSSFEQFKLSLGAVETIFAGYTGKVMGSLFGDGAKT